MHLTADRMKLSPDNAHTLRECAAPGLHDQAFTRVQRLYPSGCAPVLDLGGGTGAWTDRLARSGFGEVVALDLNPSVFAGSSQFICGDLNQDFAFLMPGRKFRLITAIEVIEHLENPAHFLRQCALLLDPDGWLVLTTPNIESMPSRIKFLVQGRIRHFDANGDPTHITPIHSFLLNRLAARAGLTVCERVGLVRFWQDGRRLFTALAAGVAPFVGGAPFGACHYSALRHVLGTGRGD